LWQHESGCGAWIVVSRNTVTHLVSGVVLATDIKRTQA
jgi:sarcosine oxidase delta subunit